MKQNKSTIFEVALQIYDFQKNETPIYFSRLVKTLDGRISRNEISRAHDILTDMGMIKESWKKEGKNFYRSIELSTHAIPFFEGIYDEVIEK